MDENKKSRKERIMTGIFSDRANAERAYNNMYERGYRNEDIDIMMSDETRNKYFIKGNRQEDSDFGNKALEGAGAGSAIGGSIGAAAGIIAAIGTSIAIPGLGIIIAGPLAAGLAGAGAGGITGGVVGALIGAGIPENKAKKYEQGIKDGKILMGVRPRTDEDARIIEEDWRSNEGKDIER